MKSFQSTRLSIFAGFGSPSLISGVEGNLSVPDVVVEGVELDEPMILRSGTLLSLRLFTILFADNGVEHEEGIVRNDGVEGGPTCVGCPFVDDGPVTED